MDACSDLLGPSQDPVADALVHALASTAGECVLAVLLFGSRLVRAAPDLHSAYDLVVVVDEYPAFYRRLVEAGHHHRSPTVLAVLARVLPPNVIAFDPALPGGELAKVMVLTPSDLERALSERARDHFLKGRLVQKVKLVHAHTPEIADGVCGLILAARREVLSWTGPWLGETFSIEEFARRMLEVSYRGEIRPESLARVAAVYEAQREFLHDVYGAMLREAESAGVVERAGERWRLLRRAGMLEGLRWRLYFSRSKIRATSRWLKHAATFADWLTYVQRKLERRTGMRVEVTPLERRLPLLLLWPKVFRVLRTLRARQGSSS